MGRAGEKMLRGVRGNGAGRTEIILGSADPLQVGVKSRTEPRPQLGQCGTVRARERFFLLSYRGRIYAKYAVGGTSGQSGRHCRGMEGLDGLFKVIRGN